MYISILSFHLIRGSLGENNPCPLSVAIYSSLSLIIYLYLQFSFLFEILYIYIYYCLSNTGHFSGQGWPRGVNSFTSRLYISKCKCSRRCSILYHQRRPGEKNQDADLGSVNVNQTTWICKFIVSSVWENCSHYLFRYNPHPLFPKGQWI